MSTEIIEGVDHRNVIILTRQYVVDNLVVAYKKKVLDALDKGQGFSFDHPQDMDTDTLTRIFRNECEDLINLLMSTPKGEPMVYAVMMERSGIGIFLITVNHWFDDTSKVQGGKFNNKDFRNAGGLTNEPWEQTSRSSQEF